MPLIGPVGMPVRNCRNLLSTLLELISLIAFLVLRKGKQAISSSWELKISAVYYGPPKIQMSGITFHYKMAVIPKINVVQDI